MDNKTEKITDKFNIAEYEGLRSEINSVQEQQRNMLITMYTLFVALFVLAVETSSFYILLTSYFILIPFQCIINKQNWSVQKISLYIVCFFEENNANIHWEGLHSYPEYKEYFKHHGDEQLIHYIGTSILAAIASLSFICERIYSIMNNNSGDLIFDIVLICVSIVLFAILLRINLKYKKDYTQELRKIMNSYKDYLNTKE